MNPTKLLLNAYYERLSEILETKQALFETLAEKLLYEEIQKSNLGEFDEEKLDAYLCACQDFFVERIETYNPIGIQYTLPPISAEEALDLAGQLDWYDSRAEFEALCQSAAAKAKQPMSDEILRQLADELIAECGAYPDKSIITAYQAQPILNKLPDYLVSLVIEQMIR